MNDAARLLTFEEQGVFTFWEADELADLVRSAGFEDVALHAAFGDPPQAAIIAARKPERGAPAPQPPEPTNSRRD